MSSVIFQRPKTATLNAKALFVLGVVGLLACPQMAFANTQPITGEWARGDDKAKVRIEPCGDNICAINTWIKEGVKDEKVNDILVMTLKQSSKSQWDGTAFDPQRRLKYKLGITMAQSSMTTKGCVLGGLVCRSVRWTRIK